MKMDMKLSISPAAIKQFLVRASGPVRKHFLFIYLFVLLISMGAGILMVAMAFSEEDTAYKQQKSQELLKDVQLNKNTKVIDHILQLQTANAGPVVPNYVPSRDNPFKE